MGTSSLEQPLRGDSNVHPCTIYVLSKNKKNSKDFLLKMFIFYNFENLYILLIIHEDSPRLFRGEHLLNIRDINDVTVIDFRCEAFVLSLKHASFRIWWYSR